MRIGVYFYGIASAAAGILDFIWGEFEPAHQPIQAWGDHIPGVTILAYVAAAWLVAAGSALLWRPAERFGAAALAILYSIFSFFPLPRFYTAPHYLGYRVAVYLGVMDGICLQLILVVAAAILWASLASRGSLSPRAATIARWTFGLCSIIFGLTHLADIKTPAAMVPSWMPLGGAFWALLSGIAFVLAGLGIVSGVYDVLAARLLGLMLLIMSIVVITPMVFAAPHDHTTWGGNAYNLTAVGAAWILAEWLAARQNQTRDSAKHAKPSLA